MTVVLAVASRWTSCVMRSVPGAVATGLFVLAKLTVVN
jgi:hypothetical protein